MLNHIRILKSFHEILKMCIVDLPYIYIYIYILNDDIRPLGNCRACSAVFSRASPTPLRISVLIARAPVLMHGGLYGVRQLLAYSPMSLSLSLSFAHYSYNSHITTCLDISYYPRTLKYIQKV